MNKESLDTVINRILAQPCPYKVPPLQYLNGHAVCPCICNAVRRAYIEGYDDAQTGIHMQVGRRTNED